MHSYTHHGMQRRAWSSDGRRFGTRLESAKRDRFSSIRNHLPIAAFLALCTILLRLPNFGDPTYHIDEAFYLFVGQRIHEGLLLYADLWDRKPAGLFFLYSVIAQFGSVHAYQLVAGIFAWATAVTVALIATRFAGRIAAGAAGLQYLALLGALAGGGGQSPVFYNLFIALAALFTLRLALGETAGPRSWHGESAMLFCGLALTIKPTALPEAGFLGLTLLIIRWRDNRHIRDLMGYAAMLCVIALAPTAAIWAYFVQAGVFGEYWFATMQSIFLTEPASQVASAIRQRYLAIMLWLAATTALLGVTILTARAVRSPGRDRIVAVFVGGWMGAALVGFLLVPNFYDHYALPLATLLAIASAPLFDRRGTGPLVALFVVAYLFVLSGYPMVQMQRKAAAQSGFATASSIIARHAGDGCLFVYDATPALYRAAPACSANKFAFPEHLSNQREAASIGDDPVRVLRLTLAQNPSVVVMPAKPSLATPNLATRDLLQRHLAEHYRKVGNATLRDVVGSQNIEIWTPVS